MADRIERLEQALVQLSALAKQEKPAGKRHHFSDLRDGLKKTLKTDRQHRPSSLSGGLFVSITNRPFNDTTKAKLYWYHKYSIYNL